MNTVCPLELAVKASDGSVIACKSACWHSNSHNTVVQVILVRQIHARRLTIQGFSRTNVHKLIAMLMMINLAPLLAQVGLTMP